MLGVRLRFVRRARRAGNRHMGMRIDRGYDVILVETKEASFTPACLFVPEIPASTAKLSAKRPNSLGAASDEKPARYHARNERACLLSLLSLVGSDVAANLYGVMSSRRSNGLSGAAPIPRGFLSGHPFIRRRQASRIFGGVDLAALQLRD